MAGLLLESISLGLFNTAFLCNKSEIVFVGLVSLRAFSYSSIFKFVKLSLIPILELEFRIYINLHNTVAGWGQCTVLLVSPTFIYLLLGYDKLPLCPEPKSENNSLLIIVREAS